MLVPHLIDDSLQKIIQSYFLDLRQKNLAKNTLIAYENDLKQFFTFLNDYQGKTIGTADLEILKARDFRSFMAYKQQNGLSASSQGRFLSAIRNFFAFLARNEGVKNSAIENLQTPKKAQNLPRPLHQADIKNIIEKCLENKDKPSWQNLRDKGLFMLLYGAGLRISEAISLNVDTIMQATDSFHIIGKGNKERVVPLLPVVKVALLNLIQTCPFCQASNSPIFCGAKGARISPRIAQKRIAEIRIDLGLPDSVTPHALRHSFATHLLSKGGNLRELQELLGHQSIAATQIYTKVETEDLINEYHDTHPRG